MNIVLYVTRNILVGKASNDGVQYYRSRSVRKWILSNFQKKEKNKQEKTVRIMHSVRRVMYCKMSNLQKAKCS